MDRMFFGGEGLEASLLDPFRTPQRTMLDRHEVEMNKLKAVVLYGGRSTEHEVSCRSASYIFRNIDRSIYDVYPIAVDKQGRWLPQNRQLLERNRPSSLPVEAQAESDTESRTLLERIWTPGTQKDDIVVFNIVHGTYGEDGCTQGFFDLQGIAYVGSGTLGSALAMDKVVAKKLVEAAGIPVVPYVSFRQPEWQKSSPSLVETAIAKLGFPMFVKPVSLGSSVGVRKVQDPSALREAIDHALAFDEQVLIETGMDVREIEYACLGDYEPAVTAPGEVVVPAGFYTYEEKYSQASKSEVMVPAHLDAKLAEAGREMARDIFRALNLYGLARIDLFLTKQGQKFYFNEANTLPGFTSISQYPKLWEHSGYSGQQLIATLLELALKRRQHQAGLKRSI
jgi:D-alanine-D-alanine ligase